MPIQDAEGAATEYDNDCVEKELTPEQEAQIEVCKNKVLQEMLDKAEYDGSIMNIVSEHLINSPELIAPKVKEMLSRRIEEKAYKLWRENNDY